MFEFRAGCFALVFLAVAGLVQPAAAQTYPTQNITLQVAFAAGGIADVVARLVGQKLSDRLGHTVVVENRGGAGGNIAAKAVSSAAPDGYTILATTTSLAVNETASKNKGFSVNDLRTVAIVAISPDVVAIHPSNPAKDLHGVHQERKGQGLHLRQRRRRHRPAYRRGVFLPRGRQGAGGARALHRRRAGGAVRDRQPRRCDRADAPDGGAADHARALARHRACERDAKHGCAECADLWRDGLPERLFRLVGRLLRAGQDPRRDRGQAQCRDQCRS